MKTFPKKSLVVAFIFSVAGIAGLTLAHAQEAATSINATTSAIPSSHTDLALIQFYSDAQLAQLLAELAATPLTLAGDLPNQGRAGTYWSLAHPNWPPLPAANGTPVWILGLNTDSSSALNSTVNSDSSSNSGSVFYLLDDIDYPPFPGGGGGTTNGYDYSGSFQAQVFTTNDLWLQITGTTNTGSSLTVGLVIHPPWNAGYNVYNLYATTNLAPAVWQWVLRCTPAQTNLVVTNLVSQTEFFRLTINTTDTDGDGLSDEYELYVSHTNTNSPSTDGSGMSDGWQWQYFGSISNNPNGDPDGDGLTTLQEYQLRAAGYNPTLWDSNGNGVSDGYEDGDGDGLANLMEGAFGCNLLSVDDLNSSGIPDWREDTDNDGIPDAWERMVPGLNWNSAESAPVLPNYSKNPIQ
jgi:hypothetical protein